MKTQHRVKFPSDSTEGSSIYYYTMTEVEKKWGEKGEGKAMKEGRGREE